MSLSISHFLISKFKFLYFFLFSSVTSKCTAKAIAIATATAMKTICIATVFAISLNCVVLNAFSTTKSPSFDKHYTTSKNYIPRVSSLAAEIGVGIDLGTTNSAIAFLNDHNEPEIIEIPNNGRTIKSVVAFDQKFSINDALVGNDAIDWEQENKENAYKHVKRVMGTSINHLSRETKEVVPHIFCAIEKASYNDTQKKKKKKKEPSLDRIIHDADLYPTRLLFQKESSGHDEISSYISPEDISSCVLKKLLTVATEHTGHSITRAVIGVPAYFNDAQRDATERSANACGIQKVKLLPEPEAAALAYGIDKNLEEEEELVLVFDLGGGTFDVSLLVVAKGLTEIICTSGNSQLGGTNFDAKLAKYISKLSYKCCKSVSSRGMVLNAAESIRIHLSNNRAAHLALPTSEEGWVELQKGSDVIVSPVTKGSNKITAVESNSTHIFCKITRTDFEQLCAHEFDEIITPIREVAIMGGALLPGDTRPSVAESAIEMNNLYSDAENFYDDDIGENDSIKVSQEINDVDIRSAKKKQQKGRKKARRVAKREKIYREESRKIQNMAPDTKIRSGISGRPISRIILVGGATRMPTIGRIISSLTGVEPQKTVDPDEAVALGCAVHVGVLDGDEDMGVVLNPMKAALLRAMIDKERREGGSSDILDEGEDA